MFYINFKKLSLKNVSLFIDQTVAENAMQPTKSLYNHITDCAFVSQLIKFNITYQQK